MSKPVLEKWKSNGPLQAALYYARKNRLARIAAAENSGPTNPVTNTYSTANVGGNGYRDQIFTVTSTMGDYSGAVQDLVDSSGHWTNQPSTAVSGTAIIFEIANMSRVITGFSITKDANFGTDVYSFQGSPDGSTWTTLATGLAPTSSTTFAASFTNTTAYKYYRLLGTGGTTSSTPSQWTEIDFTISGNQFERGARESLVTVVATGFTVNGSNGIEVSMSGTEGQTGGTNAWYPSDGNVAGCTISFTFSETVILQGILPMTSGGGGNEGVWQLQAMVNGAWVDVGTAQTWNMNDNAADWMSYLSNTTLATEYQLLGVSGTLNNGPWQEQFLFDIQASNHG